MIIFHISQNEIYAVSARTKTRIPWKGRGAAIS
jgi:hypothetical protein